jgi:hypothetical protein
VKGAPVHEKLHLFGAIGGIAKVVEEMAMAVDVDISDDSAQGEEYFVGLFAQLLLYFASRLPAMNFSDSLKMSCSVSRPNSLGP